MVVSEDIYVMLLTQSKFKAFTPREICDTAKNTEVLVCLSAESRKEVDEVVRKAVAAGGKTFNDPQDYGFMYGHAFQDVACHIWELAYIGAPAQLSNPETVLDGNLASIEAKTPMNIT